MRRRPIAAYRVIDEDELLGAGLSTGAGEAQAVDPLEVRGRHRQHREPRWRIADGWGSTAAAAAGAVGIAAVLLASSVHSSAAPPVPRTKASLRTHSPRPQHSGLFMPGRPKRLPAPSVNSAHGGAKRGLRPRRVHSLAVGHRDRLRVASSRAIRSRRPRVVSSPGPPPVVLATTAAAARRPAANESAMSNPTAAAGPAVEFGFER